MLFPIFGHSDDYKPLANIAIHINKKGEHAGFLLRVKDAILYFHMAWHYDFRVEMAPSSGYFANLKLSRPNALSFASWLKTIAKLDQNPKIPYTLREIPYSFFSDRTPFDLGGSWADSKTGAGLTCATFIVAAFDSMKFNFIDKSDWRPRDGDNHFISRVVEGLRYILQNPDPELPPEVQAGLPRHLEYIESNLHRISRVRPLDVVGATLRWDGVNFLGFDSVCLWSTCADQILKSVNILGQARPVPTCATLN